MASTTSTKPKYDPAYCLTEHLNYFSDNVAADLANDFDVVFSSANATYQAPPRPAVKHIFIEKVIILPPNFKLPDAMTQAAKGGAILPAPVTSKPLTNESNSNVIPASPTCVKQIQAHQDIPFDIPNPIVPNPMLAISAFEQQKEENFNPSSVTSLATMPTANPATASATSLAEKIQTEQVATEEPQTQKEPEPAPAKEETPTPDPITSSSSSSEPLPTTQEETSVSSETPEHPPVVQAPVVSDTDEREQPTLTTELPTRKRRASSASLAGDVRRERNRTHAKKSRQRKKEFYQSMQDALTALKAENEWLRTKLDVCQEDVPLAPQQEPTQQQGEDGLLAALQIPENRVLGDQALEELQSLFR